MSQRHCVRNVVSCLPKRKKKNKIAGSGSGSGLEYGCLVLENRRASGKD